MISQKRARKQKSNDHDSNGSNFIFANNEKEAESYFCFPFLTWAIDDDAGSKGQQLSATWFSAKSSKKVCDHEHFIHITIFVAVVSYGSFSDLDVSPPQMPFQIPLSSVTSIVDGLKRLYIQKLKPLEVTYRFNDFVSPLLVSVMYVFVYFFHYICEIFSLLIFFLILIFIFNIHDMMDHGLQCRLYSYIGLSSYDSDK